jgi:hypothetical protein
MYRVSSVTRALPLAQNVLRGRERGEGEIEREREGGR